MGLGLREVLVVVFFVPVVGSILALPLPRKWISLRVKRWILGVWVALGLMQIVDGYLNLPSRGADATMLYGISEMFMFGAGFLVFTETRWKKVIGGLVIFIGIFLMLVAGVMSSTAPHG